MTLIKNDAGAGRKRHDQLGKHRHAVLASGIVHRHFNVHDAIPQQQLLAWRDRVGHIIDVLPSRTQIENPFNAAIDSYEVGNTMLTDCRSDAVVLQRSVARISTDNIRTYAFHVFLQGGITSVSGRYSAPNNTPAGASILVLDMNQPVRMQRTACRMLTLFVPRSMVEASFPDAESMHGRVLEDNTAPTQLLIDHVAALNQQLPSMSVGAANQGMAVAAELLTATFHKQAGLHDSARAAARAALFGWVRRYIRANLHQSHLSPENLLDSLQLPRRTLYNMFAHEGGLGAYIRNCRLREAANELVKFPDRAVLEIAYGLGFKSAQDFSRAFRRAYDMAPQDLRSQASQRIAQSAPDTDERQ